MESEEYMYLFDNKEEIKFFRKCFEIRMDNHFSSSNSKRFFVNNNDLNSTQISHYCSIYVFLYANEEEKDMYNKYMISTINRKKFFAYRDVFDKFCQLQKCSDEDLSIVRLYVENCSLKEERDLYNIVSVRYKEKFGLSFEMKLREMFNAYINYGPNSKELFQLAQQFEYSSDVVSSCAIKYCKLFGNEADKWLYKKRVSYDKKSQKRYIYDFCEKVDYDDERLKVLADEIGISVDKLKEIALKYKKEELGIPTLKLFPKNVYQDIIEELMSIECDSDTIISLFGRYDNIRLRDLKGKVYDYIVTRYKNRVSHDVMMNMVDDVRGKISIYQEYNKTKNEIARREQRKKDLNNQALEIFNQGRYLVEEYIASSLDNKEDFCKIKNIDLNYFYKLISAVEKCSIELYERYMDKVRYNQSKRYAFLKCKINKIADLIKNGITTEDGGVKAFEFLDYYMETKLPPTEFLKISDRILSIDDTKVVRTFFGMNRKQLPINLTQNLSIKYNINIGGVLYEVTDEEKILVYNYLKNSEIPLFQSLFRTALKRYLIGELVIDRESEKTL